MSDHISPGGHADHSVPEPPAPVRPQSPPVIQPPVGQPQSSWPTVFGILAIVLGAGGILANGVGLLSPLIMDWAMSFSPGTPQISGASMAVSWVVTLVNLAVSILLLVVGVKLLKRSPGAPLLAMRWAWIRIVMVLVSIVVQTIASIPQLEKTQADMAAQGVNMGGGFLWAMMAFGLLFGLVWGMWLPVLFLIWFRRPRIRDEVAGWGGGVRMAGVEPV